MARHVRILILGAGSAGLNAYKEAKRFTEDILMVDPGPWGTTCARVGCMPSKVLLKAAHDVAIARKAIAKGYVRGEIGSLQDRTVMERVRQLRDRFAAGPRRTVESLGDRIIAAPASFVAPDTVEVAGEHISADAIIVATGSHPIVPGSWRTLEERLITSDSVFELETLPRRVGIVGLGAVGSELGQGLAMLGCEVHAFAKEHRVGTLADPVANHAATRALCQDMSLHTGHPVEPAAHGDGVRVGFGEVSFDVDMLLVAMGRAPSVGGMNLEALGLDLDERGLPPIDPHWLQAGDAPVYFAGDVNTQHPVLHEAADDGRIAAHHALNPKSPCLTRRTSLAIVFTDPEIARVGTPYDQLPADALVAELDYSGQGRGIIYDVEHGVARVYADRQGYLLGAELVVPHAEHLAHELAWLIAYRAHVNETLQLPFYHPVLEEGLRTAFQDLRHQAGLDSGPDLPLCGRPDDPVPGA